MEEIYLREALIKDIPLLENYALDPRTFMKKPMDVLAESQHETDIHPILILNETGLIGFFILQLGESVVQYTENKNAVLFAAHSIDLNYQKQGYAKKSLQLLPDYVRIHFPAADEIVLSIEADNISSQMLYARSGFNSKHRQVKIKGKTEFVYSQTVV